MKPAPRKSLPKKRPSSPTPDLAPRDLLAWQQTMHAALTRPLAPGDRAQRRWFDGSSSARAVAKLVKPSKTLEPLERVEIYNRMYWFRLLDCIATDFPGLRALMGEERFWKMTEAYLAAHPSSSFTLRNLGRWLPAFLTKEPHWTEPHAEAARDLARFEWAQIVAFDGPSLTPLKRKQLGAADAATLRLRVQPYLTLLTCRHAVDEYVLAVKNDGALRTEASNAVTERSAAASSVATLARTSPIHIVVHRADNQLYYKRLEPAAARLLRALASGRSLADACGLAFARTTLAPAEQAMKIKAWFALWMRLGWLCARE